MMHERLTLARQYLDDAAYLLAADRSASALARAYYAAYVRRESDRRLRFGGARCAASSRRAAEVVGVGTSRWPGVTACQDLATRGLVGTGGVPGGRGGG